MTPANERKAAERQRRKDAGLVRVEVWVHPQHVQDVKDFAFEMNETVPKRKPLTPGMDIRSLKAGTYRVAATAEGTRPKPLTPDAP